MRFNVLTELENYAASDVAIYDGILFRTTPGIYESPAKHVVGIGAMAKPALFGGTLAGGDSKRLVARYSRYSPPFQGMKLGSMKKSNNQALQLDVF